MSYLLRLLHVIIVVGIFLHPVWPASAEEMLVQRSPNIYPSFVGAAAFILDDTTGRTLYAYHADTLRYPASTVKMLTALVVIRQVSLDRIVTVPEHAEVGGTTANLVPGERISVRQLLYGMLLPSGNDAAVTLGDAVAGSTWAFGFLMNAEARRLHLWHSHFIAPHGFDLANQYSTARDLAWTAHALLRNPFLAGVVHTRVYQSVTADGHHHIWVNLNKLLWSYPGTIGVKTGTTPLAGANLVAAVTRQGHRIIVVIMGSTIAARFAGAESLLDYGWEVLGLSPRTRQI